MTCTRILIGYVFTWIAVEICRPYALLTQLVWAHDLFLFGAITFGLLLASMAAEEWVREGD